MKKSIVLIVLLGLLFIACDNYIVLRPDLGVLNSSVSLSGEVTGDIVSSVRTMRMHVTGQPRNYLLVEIFGMETYAGTESMTVMDMISGTDVNLSLIDNGPVTDERVYRNIQFWLGPFERDEYYTLHLTEAESANFRDTLSLSFQYAQSQDLTVQADNCGYMLSEYPMFRSELPTPYFDSQNLPDSLATYADYAPDNIYIEEQDSSLLIISIVTGTSGTIFHAYPEIDADTLKMYAWTGPIPLNASETRYYFFYTLNNYIGQRFYYTFDFNIFTMFEGIYNR